MALAGADEFSNKKKVHKPVYLQIQDKNLK